MVMAMICHPGQWGSGRIEDGEEYEKVLDPAVQFQGAVRKAPVITDRRSNPADRGDCQGHQEYAPAWQWKQD
jgi:hypothetical protein